MHLGIPAFHACSLYKLTKDRFLRVDRLLNGEERMPVSQADYYRVVDEIQRDWESYD